MNCFSKTTMSLVSVATLALTISLTSVLSPACAETASDTPLTLTAPPNGTTVSQVVSPVNGAETDTNLKTIQNHESTESSATQTPPPTKYSLFKQSADTKGTASAYVSSVFDRIQSAWLEQSYQDTDYPSQILTFTLNEDGTLANTATNHTIPASLLQAIQQKGSFAPFPEALKGQQLEIKAQVSPDSLELLGYRQIKNPQKDTVITYLSPETNQQATSLFYARALPATVGQVKAESESFSSGASNTEMNQYVNMVQRQIQRNWRLASDYPFQKTSALLMIDRNGELLGAQLQHSSGDKVADEAALNAIYTAGPFPKAPADVPSLPIIIETIFEPMAAPVKE